MKMSEICRKAANEYLRYDTEDSRGKWWTVFYALDDAGGSEAAMCFLGFLDGESEDRLSRKHGELRQGARFMLLHFAALYFEDLGK
jgi:hypothetical protein